MPLTQETSIWIRFDDSALNECFGFHVLFAFFDACRAHYAEEGYKVADIYNVERRHGGIHADVKIVRRPNPFIDGYVAE